MTVAVSPARGETEILALLRSEFSRFYGLPVEQIDPRVTFLALGADSLSLLQASQAIEEKFGVKIPFRVLMEDLATLEAVARHLAAEIEKRTPAMSGSASVPAAASEGPAALPAIESPQPLPPALSVPMPAPVAAADGSSGLERLFSAQLQLMAQQLELLGSRTGLRAASRAEAPRPGLAAPTRVVAPTPAAPPAPSPSLQHPQPERGAVQPNATPTPYSPSQLAHIAALVERLARATAKSKEKTQRFRQAHADSRTASGFRRLWKEATYQLIVERAAGSHFTDVDGRDYLDLAMGFGALLFGHSPPFLIEAVRRQLDFGLQLGPQSDLAGEVAELIRELTGVERVAFTNSGTEAVMSALRLARAVTGRERVAFFLPSYHGTFDGVMARPAPENPFRALPLAPGVPKGYMAQALPLVFGSDESLTEIERRGGELAAVLMEPVASRQPRLDREFTAKLRRVTDSIGAALIFDEVITGFRTHPGGCKALLGVEPDLVTYGKAVSAGMPIGVVAGRARFMDAIDGGMWRYGDDSLPPAQTTIFRGTFFKHPLVMAAARASLSHLKREGPALQARLTARTDELTARLREVGERAGVGLGARNFTSLFLFGMPPEVRATDLDVFFFHLLEQGIYVWEGRTCYLSTAHTDADLEHLVKTVERVIAAMMPAGFLGAAAAKGASQVAVPETSVAPVRLASTATQRDLWTECQFAPDASRAYHESVAIYLLGSGLDREALGRAATRLTQRHDALRTAYADNGETLVVAPRVAVKLEGLELDDAGQEEANEARFSAWLGEQSTSPFVLDRAPLWRAGLARLAGDAHVLTLTWHHLITDGWSTGLLLHDLAALYAHELGAADAPPLAEPGRLARGLARLPDPTAVEQHWLEIFADSVPRLDLPTDRPAGAETSWESAEESLRLEPETWSRLRQLSEERGVTPLALLFSTFEILLHRLSGQRDLVVGTAAAGQPALGEPRLAGYFVSLLPLRSRFEPQRSFISRAAETGRRLLDGFEHQGYPLSRLARRLGVAREVGRPLLVSATFNLDRPLAGLELPGLSTEIVRLPPAAAKFELAVNAMEEPEGLRLDWEFRAALFDRATIARWASSFGHLIAAVVAAPETSVGRLELVSENERAEILAIGRGARPAFLAAGGLAGAFERVAASQPQTPALVFADLSLSYAELDKRSAAMAWRLLEAGIRPGELVAIFLERSGLAIVATLSAIRAGAAYLPLDLEAPPERLAAALADSGAGMVLTTTELAPRLPVLSLPVLDLAMGDGKSKNRPVLPPPAPAEALAYVIFTSGSTGRPKGVAVPQLAVLRLVLGSDYVRLGPGDRVGQIANLSFDAATFEIWGALTTGATLVGLTPEEALAPRRLAARLAQLEVDTLFLTTALFEQTLREEPTAFAGLRELLFGGQRVDPTTVAQALAPGRAPRRLLHVYGPTEVTTFATWDEVRAVPTAAKSVPIGRPIAHTDLLLLDADGCLAPRGAPGELALGGPGLAHGYLGRGRATAEKFVPHAFATSPGERLYRTGDLARLLADGRWDFLGRTDEQVKIRGFRVEPGEIEAVLARHPGLLNAVVRARPVGGAAQHLVAWVVPSGDVAPTVAELRRFLAASLPSYMVPAEFVPLSQLPLSKNGKLDPKALPEPAGGSLELGSTYEAPTSEAERTLARIFAEVLGRERVGVADNFFDLGGDSIQAIQIVSKAAEAGFELKPKQLFQSPTVAELAALAVVTSSAPGEPSAEAIDETAGREALELPLTPIERWFWELDLAEPDHFNQAFLYELRRPVTTPQLEEALRALLDRHPVLRSVYRRTAAGARHLIGGQKPPLDCREVDLSTEPLATRSKALAAAAEKRQRAFSVAEGRIFNATLFRLGEGEPDRLLLIAHHLAVDFVSWQMVRDELEARLEANLEGRQPRLPAGGPGFELWATRMERESAGPAVAAELERWRLELISSTPPLPLDGYGGENLEGGAESVIHSLELSATRPLLRELPKALGAQIHEALLAALGATLCEWVEGDVLVHLEGHGREDLFPDLSPHRTVGWFTSLVPVRLSRELFASFATDPVACLGEISKRQRQRPHGGIGWGLLRWGAASGHTAELASWPCPEVSFNYLGRLGEMPAKSLLSAPLPDPVGATRSPLARRAHALDLNALVAQDGRLHLYWSFHPALHSRATVERLGQQLLEALRCLAELSTAAPSPRRPTEPDLSLVNLQPDELAGLLAGLEIATPAAP